MTSSPHNNSVSFKQVYKMALSLAFVCVLAVSGSCYGSAVFELPQEDILKAITSLLDQTEEQDVPGTLRLPPRNNTLPLNVREIFDVETRDQVRDDQQQVFDVETRDQVRDDEQH